MDFYTNYRFFIYLLMSPLNTYFPYMFLTEIVIGAGHARRAYSTDGAAGRNKTETERTSRCNERKQRDGCRYYSATKVRER